MKQTLEVERQGIVDSYTEHVDGNGNSSGRSSKLEGALGNYEEHRDVNGILVGTSTTEKSTGIEVHRDINGAIKGTTIQDGQFKRTIDTNGITHNLQYGHGGASLAANEQATGGSLISLINKKTDSLGLTLDNIDLSKEITLNGFGGSSEASNDIFNQNASIDSGKKDFELFGAKESPMQGNISNKLPSMGANLDNSFLDKEEYELFGSSDNYMKETPMHSPSNNGVDMSGIFGKKGKGLFGTTVKNELFDMGKGFMK